MRGVRAQAPNEEPRNRRRSMFPVSAWLDAGFMIFPSGRIPGRRPRPSTTAAAKAGDTQVLAAAKAAWYANANDIAGFLHNLNPREWPLNQLQSMMQQHLDLTLTEAVDQLQGNFAQSVSDFDAVEAEILQMADTLSAGVIAQFPSAFA